MVVPQRQRRVCPNTKVCFNESLLHFQLLKISI
jgi:hypothetical protein